MRLNLKTNTQPSGPGSIYQFRKCFFYGAIVLYQLDYRNLYLDKSGAPAASHTQVKSGRCITHSEYISGVVADGSERTLTFSVESWA